MADALTKKVMLAAKKVGAKQLVLCGGVAANSRLRGLAQERADAGGLKLYLPARRLCTDNGAMIAVAGAEAYRRGVRSDLSLNSDPSWRL